MNRIYVAFPGSGKTSYVKEQKLNPKPGSQGCVDLDIKGPNQWKARRCPADIRKTMSDYVAAVIRNGGEVCTHVDSFLPDRNFGCEIVIVVPEIGSRDEWVARVRARDGDCQFVKDLANNFYNWIEGWFRFADELAMAGNEVIVCPIDGHTYLVDIIKELDGVDEANA